MMESIVNFSELFALGLGTVIGATTVLATAHLGQRRIAIQNITQERRKWRENIRMKALEVHDALICPDEVTAELKLVRLKAEMRCLLNPSDNYDNALLKTISVPKCTCVNTGSVGCKQQCESGFIQAKIFSKHVASLLKHDWERSKLEASSLPKRLYLTGWLIKLLFSEPVRSMPETVNGKSSECALLEKCPFSLIAQPLRQIQRKRIFCYHGKRWAFHFFAITILIYLVRCLS